MGIQSFLRRGSRSGTIIYDIGSASVGAAYATFEKDKPLIHANTRVSCSADVSRTFARYLHFVLSSLENLSLTFAHKKEFRHPRRILCFLPSVLYVSELRVITHEKKHETKVTMDLIKELARKEIEAFEREVDFSDSPIPGNDSYVLEAKILDVKLNGYEVADPVGKTARSISVTLFLSYTSREVVRKIVDVASRVFHKDEIEFHSHVYALFDTIRTHVGTGGSFTLFNITGEVTDVLAIVNNELKTLASVPFGYQTLIRHLADRLGVPPSEAHTIARLYQAGNVHDEVKQKTERAFSEVRETWVIEMDAAIGKLSEKSRIPTKFYLVGEETTAALFKEWLSEDQGKFFVANKPLAIQLVSERVIEHLFSRKKGSMSDTILAVETIFTKKLI